jgi:hypothetical protein
VYSRDEVDILAAYCHDTRLSYLLPPTVFEGRSAVTLRLAPSRNNQELGIRWAKDYEFAATLSRLGAIAQLGERLRGTQEVAGSSPAGSTSQAVEGVSPEAALF